MPDNTKQSIQELEGLVDYEMEVSDEYYEPSAGFDPLPAGVHIFTDSNLRFDKTADGLLTVVVDSEGQSEKVAGRVFTFHRIYAKPYYRPPGGARSSGDHAPNVSGLLDWLRAKGYAGTLRTLPRLGSPEGRAEFQALVDNLLPMRYKIRLGIEGSCSNPDCLDQAKSDKRGKAVRYVPFPSVSRFPERKDASGATVYDERGKPVKRFEGLTCDRCSSEVQVRNVVGSYLKEGA